jgi:hypothetical protein
MYSVLSPPLQIFCLDPTCVFAADPTRPPLISEISGAAVITGAFISVLVAPIEGVKARLQVQYNAGSATYKGPVDCFKKVCCRFALVTEGASLIESRARLCCECHCDGGPCAVGRLSARWECGTGSTAAGPRRVCRA